MYIVFFDENFDLMHCEENAEFIPRRDEWVYFQKENKYGIARKITTNYLPDNEHGPECTVRIDVTIVK